MRMFLEYYIFPVRWVGHFFLFGWVYYFFSCSRIPFKIPVGMVLLILFFLGYPYWVNAGTGGFSPGSKVLYILIISCPFFTFFLAEG